MWRKRKTPSPSFRMPPPLDPFSGQHQGLPGERDRTRVALFQVCESDTHNNYVVCRGYDTEEGRFFKTLAVAKPYDRRGYRDYMLAEMLTCCTVSSRLGDNAGKASVTTGNPSDLDEEIVLLYDDNDKPIRWIHIGTGMRLRMVELWDTLWPKGAAPTVFHPPPSTSSSSSTSSTSSTSTTPDPTTLPAPARFDDARGWVLFWDFTLEEFTAPDYNSEMDVMVHERASSYFGLGKRDAPYGKRGDIVAINEHDIVVGGPYPILMTNLMTSLGCGGTAATKFADAHASATLSIDAWDRMETMNAQVNPCADPLEVRTAASANDGAEVRWNKYPSKMEIITLGGECDEGSPCYCEYICQGGDPETNAWWLLSDNCDVICDQPYCEPVLSGPCVEYDILNTACNWAG